MQKHYILATERDQKHRDDRTDGCEDKKNVRHDTQDSRQNY